MRVNLLKSLIRLLCEADLGGVGIYLRPLESKALSLAVERYLIDFLCIYHYLVCTESYGLCVLVVAFCFC